MAHSFDRNEALEGIAPEDEAEVAALVNQVLGGPVAAPRGPGSPAVRKTNVEFKLDEEIKQYEALVLVEARTLSLGSVTQRRR